MDCLVRLSYFVRIYIISTGSYKFEDIPEKRTLALLDFLSENSLGAYVKDKTLLDFYSGIPLENVPKPSDKTDAMLITIDGSSGLINRRERYDSRTYSVKGVFDSELSDLTGCMFTCWK